MSNRFQLSRYLFFNFFGKFPTISLFRKSRQPLSYQPIRPKMPRPQGGSRQKKTAHQDRDGSSLNFRAIAKNKKKKKKKERGKRQRTDGHGGGAAKLGIRVGSWKKSGKYICIYIFLVWIKNVETRKFLHSEFEWIFLFFFGQEGRDFLRNFDFSCPKAVFPTYLRTRQFLK